MPVLEIEGRDIEVDESFLRLSPDQQNATVEEIAREIGVSPRDASTSDGGSDPESDQSKNLRAELSSMTQNPARALYEQRPEWQKPIIAAQDIFTLGLNGASMGFADKGAALVRSAVTGDSYDDELQEMRARTQAARDRAGSAGDVAEIGGAVAAPMALASRGATLAGRFGTAGMEGAKGIAARAGLMGAEGAAYGAASAIGNDTDLATGVVVGGGIGAAVPVVAGVGKAVAKPLADAVRARTNPAGYASEKVAERIGSSMSPEQAARRLTSIPGSNLADVGGKSARDLLRTAANIPGPGRDKISSRLTIRQFGQGDRLKSAVARTFADPDGYLAAKDEIAAEAERLARPLYQQAYRQPVHFSKALEGVLETPAGKSALRKAEELAANEGIPFQQLFMSIPDDGTQATVRRVPDTRGWDYIKRAFDDMIQAQTDSITKKVTNEGRILVALKNKMLSEVDRYNPTYKSARQVYAGQAEIDEALELGRDVFKVSPEALKRAVADMNPAQRASARIGAAEALRAQIDAAGVTNNSVIRIFSKPSQMKNLQTLFETPEKFAEFRKTIFAEARKRATYDAVKGNSTTAAQMADMMEAGALREGFEAAKTLAFQGPINATLQFLTSRLRMLGGLTPEVADNIARQLTASDPKAVHKLIGEISKIERARLTAAQRQQAIQAMLARSAAAGGAYLATAPRVLGQERREPTVIDVQVPLR